MKRPAFRHRIRTKLLMLVLVAVVPAITIAVLQHLELRRTEMARASEGVRTLSEVIAATVKNHFNNSRQLLTTVAEFSPLVEGTNQAFSNVHLENLLKISPGYANFGLIERDGTLFAASKRGDDPGVNLADRSYFNRAVSTRRFAVGNYQVGRLTGEPSVNFAKPILDSSGEAKRVFFASIHVQQFEDAARSVTLPEGAVATVLDQNGVILARLPERPEVVGRSILTSEAGKIAFNHGPRTFVAKGVDDVRRFYSLTTVYEGSAPGMHVLVGIPTNVLFGQANKALIISLIFLAVVTACAMYASNLLAKNSVLDPVAELASSADRLAQGDLAARADIPADNGELHQLSLAFNRMAEQLQTRAIALQSASDTINELNRSLEQRVAARTAELQAANSELEAFSYSVSHDLRAPLRHLDGFAQMLHAGQFERLDEKGKRHLNIISASAKKMGVLIDELLIFSRMGRQELIRIPLDTEALVKEAIATALNDAQGRKIEWEIGALPSIVGDLPMMRQVWVNLISNAVKYTGKREVARIEIGATQEKEETVFFVRDNGAGFDMQYADKLFGVFQRLHSEKEFEGTGIGLANVRRIVSRHGGRTWAKSIVEEGATFYFSIPFYENTRKPASNTPG